MSIEAHFCFPRVSKIHTFQSTITPLILCRKSRFDFCMFPVFSKHQKIIKNRPIISDQNVSNCGRTQHSNLRILKLLQYYNKGSPQILLFKYCKSIMKIFGHPKMIKTLPKLPNIIYLSILLPLILSQYVNMLIIYQLCSYNEFILRLTTRYFFINIYVKSANI